jgi:hypothetical protein
MGKDMDSQLYAAAVCLARQLGNGDLDGYPVDKEAAERKLSSHVRAGDISQHEVDGLLRHEYAAAS